MTIRKLDIMLTISCILFIKSMNTKKSSNSLLKPEALNSKISSIQIHKMKDFIFKENKVSVRF